MSMPGFLEIKAENQGIIEGSCVKEGVEKTIEIYSFDHKVDIPKNQDTGLYIGTRSHKPILVQKEIDKSSPKLYQALCTGEKLTEVKFSWYRFVTGGKPQKYYTILLSNATIVEISPTVPLGIDSRLENIPHLEKVFFTYEKIRWTWVPDGGEFEDSWLSSE